MYKGSVNIYDLELMDSDLPAKEIVGSLERERELWVIRCASGAAWLTTGLFSSRLHVPLHQLWDRRVDLNLKQVCSASCSQIPLAALSIPATIGTQGKLHSPLPWPGYRVLQGLCTAQFQAANPQRL